MAQLAAPYIGDHNTWLGAFGEAWFAAICNVAACSTYRPDRDVHSTDVIVQDHRAETVRVQVKTTVQPQVVDDTFRFSLDIASYDRLRAGTAPGYLVLVVVQSAHPRWTGHSRRGSIVRAAAYYKPLAGEPAVADQATTTVALPFANMLTPARVLTLFP